MNFYQLLKTRYSVRSYKSTPVEPEKLEQILEAGRLAPSAANFQPWHFIVVQNAEKQTELLTVYNREWIKEAPLIIVACADHSTSWKRASDGKDAADIDLAIAIDHMTLMASELELGTCWVCNFNVQLCSKILQLPQYIEPIALLPLGYPADKLQVKKRKALSEITHLNTFGNKY